METSTLCVHGAENTSSTTGAVTVPIYQTATYARSCLGETAGYDYSRVQNPTREYLEKTIANLEGGSGALAFASGMAAIAALMDLFEAGDSILASDDLYGGSVRLFDNTAAKHGVEIQYVNTSDLAAVSGAIQPNTKAIFIETPTNPMMRITDIAGASALAKKNKLLLIVDNTFLTPYFQKPLALGADIVMHSGTKYLSGHNDTLAGFIVCASSEIEERLRFISKTTGACLSPFDSYLLIRGIKTLALRMERHEKNARILVDWLSAHPKVAKVYYPGLVRRQESPESSGDKSSEAPGFPAGELALEIVQKQASGFDGKSSAEKSHAESPEDLGGKSAESSASKTSESPESSYGKSSAEKSHAESSEALDDKLALEILQKQASGFGGMISFETDTEQTAVKVLESVRLILFAESLGGVETLITYPLTQTHADIPREKREQNGINERLLRLSVGIEDVRDIIEDLQQALG